MKKDNEWLKAWFDDNKSYPGGYVKYKIDQLDVVKNLSQELPVIPKFVAEWIAKHRDTYDLYPALRMLENNTLVWSPIYKWYRMNTHKFVNAYLTGKYEAEEDQEYYALIKGHELLDTDRFYWIYDKYEESVFISKVYSLHGNFLTEMSKLDWGEYGINDSNADFVKVEEYKYE